MIPSVIPDSFLAGHGMLEKWMEMIVESFRKVRVTIEIRWWTWWVWPLRIWGPRITPASVEALRQGCPQLELLRVDNNLQAPNPVGVACDALN